MPSAPPNRAKRFIVEIKHFIQSEEFRFAHDYWASLRNNSALFVKTLSAIF